MKTALKKGKLLHGFLIDPYRQEVHRIGIGKELDDWRKALRCEWIEHMFVSRDANYGYWLDLWFDEEFALADKLKPSFRFRTAWKARGPQVVCGYGLLLASNPEGQSKSLFLTPEGFYALMGEDRMGLSFENWEGHPELHPGEDFTEEQLRNIELEMPGRFRYSPGPEEVENLPEQQQEKENDQCTLN